jgi:hypothetical protein
MLRKNFLLYRNVLIKNVPRMLYIPFLAICMLCNIHLSVHVLVYTPNLVPSGVSLV